MKGYPPTCAECGSLLLGFATSEELGFPVYYCLRCTRPEAVRHALKMAATEETAAEERILAEAA